MESLPSTTKGNNSRVNKNSAITREENIQDQGKWYGEYGQEKCTLIWFHKQVLSSPCEPGTGHKKKKKSDPGKQVAHSWHNNRKWSRSASSFQWTWRFTRWTVGLEEREGRELKNWENIWPVVSLFLWIWRQGHLPILENNETGLEGRWENEESLKVPQVRMRKIINTKYRGTSGQCIGHL